MFNIRLIILIIIIITINIYSQGEFKINQLDNTGKKIGLWIENNGLSESYYRAGMKEGIFKAYNKKNGKLSAMGEYKNDKQIGIWYYFNESSHLMSIVSEIRHDNKIEITLDFGNKTIPESSAQITFFYPSGVKKMEGHVLYNDDIEIDYYEIGVWNFYNEFGELIEKKEFLKNSSDPIK